MFYLLHSSAIVLLVLLSYKLGYKQAKNKEKINLWLNIESGELVIEFGLVLVSLHADLD